MKRVVSLFTVVLIILAMIPLSVFASDTTDFKYTLSDDGTYYVLEEYVGSETEVAIPSRYNSLPVKVIGAAAFQHKETMKKVSLPSTVTRIETYAFSHCYALTDINIPSTVEFIGSCAFSDCFALRQIAIPNSVLTTEFDVFRRCDTSLKIYCEAKSQPETFNSYWISSAANPPSAYWGYYSRGDVNNNASVETTDYVLVRRTVMETYVCSQKAKLAADIDGDGSVDIIDYLLLKRIVMGTL